MKQIWTIYCSNESVEVHCLEKDTHYEGLIENHKLSENLTIVRCKGKAYLRKKMLKDQFIK